MTSAVGSRSTWALLTLVLASCSNSSTSASSAQAAGPGALRLNLHPTSSIVSLGTPVDVTISLRDAQGGRASATHMLQVELSVERGPRKTIELKPGDTEVDVSVTPTREGILEIRAAGRELVPGTCVVKVTRPEPSQARARQVPRGARP